MLEGYTNHCDWFVEQVSARVERQAGEAARQETELSEEGRAQELEVADITANYQRLEKVVVAHLQVRFMRFFCSLACMHCVQYKMRSIIQLYPFYLPLSLPSLHTILWNAIYGI